MGPYGGALRFVRDGHLPGRGRAGGGEGIAVTELANDFEKGRNITGLRARFSRSIPMRFAMCRKSTLWTVVVD